MNNEETEISWNYHNGTKHPNGIFLTRPHFYDSALRPNPYKIYSTQLPEISLKTTKLPQRLSALESISGTILQNESKTLDIASLANILYYSGGITKTINFAGLGDFEFRAASCTGALYHIEIYLVCGDIDGLEAGVYHFDPQKMKLYQLRKGDFRDSLVKSTKDPAIKHAPAVLVYTDIPTRNSVKYRTREYRHAFWDCGTIIANTLAVCQSNGFASKVVMGFVDDTVNRLVDLDTEKELSIALVPIGYTDSISEEKQLEIPTLNLQTEPLSNYEYDDLEIKKMHQGSSFSSLQQIKDWKLDYSVTCPTSTNCIELKQQNNTSSNDTIEETIIKRGSTRKFSREFISFEQLSDILYYSTRGVSADYLEKSDHSIIDLYVIANSVQWIGILVRTILIKSKTVLQVQYKQGDFRTDAMHLGLNQALPLDGSVCVFYMADLEKILNKLGNRGYQSSPDGGKYHWRTCISCSLFSEDWELLALRFMTMT